MLSTEIQDSIRQALMVEDSSKRLWAFARAVTKISGVQELEDAWTFIQSLSESSEGIRLSDNISLEIEKQKKWIPQLELVDSALKHYPKVAERVTGINYKVALLDFADICESDVHFVCALLQEIIIDLELGTKKVHKWFEDSLDKSQWPRNYKPFVLRALASHWGLPCWLIRNLFLPEIIDSGVCCHEFSFMVEFCVVPRETPDEPQMRSSQVTIGLGRFW